MKKINQAGSTVVVILLVLILTAVVGFAGYSVYNSQKDKDNLSNAKATSSQSNEKSSTSDSKFLEIKELGVKMKLEPELGTVTYKYSNENNREIVILMSDLQATLPDSCPYKKDSPWGIQRLNTEPGVQDASTKIGEYNYVRVYPQLGCEDASAIMNPLDGAYNRSFITLGEL